MPISLSRVNAIRTLAVLLILLAVLLTLLLVSVNFPSIMYKGSTSSTSASNNTNNNNVIDNSNSTCSSSPINNNNVTGNCIKFVFVLIRASEIPYLIGKPIGSIYGVATCINGRMELGSIYVLPTTLIGGTPVLEDSVIKHYHIFFIQLPLPCTTLHNESVNKCDWGPFVRNLIRNRVVVTLKNYFQLEGDRIVPLNNVVFYIYYDEGYDVPRVLPMNYYKYLSTVFGVEPDQLSKLYEIIGELIDRYSSEIVVEREVRIDGFN